MPADSFEEGAEDALVAPGLGQKMEGALRAALFRSRLDSWWRREGRSWVCGAENWRQRVSAVSVDLRCGCARQRRAADSVVIRGDNASRVELAKRDKSAADFQYFAQARVQGVKLLRRVAIACVLQDANQATRLVGVLDYAFVITTFSALVSVPNDFSRYFVGPLQVLCELDSESTHVARRLRQR